jgi:hypothetical protein
MDVIVLILATPLSRARGDAETRRVLGHEEHERQADAFDWLARKAGQLAWK